MSASFVNLLPMAIVAFGAMVCIATEPFVADKNKQKVLPWVASAFLVLSAISFVFVKVDAAPLFGFFEMGALRMVLSLAVLLCAFLGIGGLQVTLAREKYPAGEPYGLALLATVGVLIMVQSVDFIPLFVGMELAAYPIYGLVGLRRKDRNANEATFKYFVTGAVFSVVFLYGMSLIYGATGTTHFGGKVLAGRELLYSAGVLLSSFALLFKAGAAPIHFWVADVYSGASVAVTGFMAAVVKVGALAALGALWMRSGVEKLAPVMIVVAILSIVIGSLSGIAQKSIRRIIAFSAVMNAGFMVLGLVSKDLSAMYYFLVTYALGSAGALAAISAFSGKNDEKENLDDIRGQGRRRPLEGIAAVVCLASLAGLPPLSGFLAKFVLFSGVVSSGFVALAAFGFVFSIVAIYYYLRVAISIFAPAEKTDDAKNENALSSSTYFLLRLGVTVTSIALVCLALRPIFFQVKTF